MTDGAAGVARHPLVSIGVPVFNGERFLAQALDSLLGQTLTDLELIISDNASTDGTRDIGEAYARRDARVRYVRQRVNLGGPRNWNAVVHEARGTFFKWASGSDYCAPVMLEKCVQAMLADPDIVLCQGRTQLVDEHGRPLEVYGGDTAYEDDRPSERFSRVLLLMRLNNAQSGVIRLDALRRTRLDRLYPSGDIALMAELALYGKFHVVPEVLLFRRQSAGTLTSALTPLERQRFHDPKAKAPMAVIGARRHLDNLVSIARAPVSVVEKLRAYREALKMVRWERGELWREFRSALGGGRGTA